MSSQDLSLKKLPPQNIEAERAVLAAILLDNRAINHAVEVLKTEDFYRESHRKIFEAMLDLNESNEGIDLITLSDRLRAKKHFEAVGGDNYLLELLNSVATAANARFHAKLVHEDAMSRDLIRIATDIVTQGYNHEGKADDLLDQAEKNIFAITDKSMRATFTPMKELVKAGFEIIEKLSEQRLTGLPTKFKDLDKMTSGLQPSDLVIVAGRPSMGKTAFALGMAQNIALSQNQTVGIFSLEMSKEQLVLRMLCSEARVDAHKLRSGFLGQPGNNNWRQLIDAAGRLSEAPVFIDDTPSMTVLEMRAKARRLKAEHDLSLIIVDYLQLMRGRGDANSREQEISDISRSLKGLAKELKIPVVALSQLSPQWNPALKRKNDRYWRIYGNQGQLNRTPTWSCLSTGRRFTTPANAPPKGNVSAASGVSLKSSSASSETGRLAMSRWPSSTVTHALRISPMITPGGSARNHNSSLEACSLQ